MHPSPTGLTKNWSHLSWYVHWEKIPHVQKRVCYKHSRTDLATSLEHGSGWILKSLGKQNCSSSFVYYCSNSTTRKWWALSYSEKSHSVLHRFLPSPLFHVVWMGTLSKRDDLGCMWAMQGAHSRPNTLYIQLFTCITSLLCSLRSLLTSSACLTAQKPLGSHSFADQKHGAPNPLCWSQPALPPGAASHWSAAMAHCDTAPVVILPLCSATLVPPACLPVPPST